VADDRRAGQIAQISELVRERYVFPEVGEQVAATLAGKAYDEGLSDEAFAAAVTADLQSVNGDKHLRLVYKIDPLAEGEEPWDLDRYRADARHNGYGLPRVERLAGNVGVLEVRALFAPEVAGPAVTGAFSLLAHTDALIIDLRRSPGGAPAQVQFICSYLFDESIHLNSIYNRTDEKTSQFWTHGYVPGERYGGSKPVWVLTSAATFSGGEELAYNMQAHKRGTLVGETTRGGAHPTDWHRVDAHLQATVPFARSINPVTNTNWEGTGVVPDIAVPAAEAFDRANKLALEYVLTLGDTGLRRTTAAEATEALAALPG
jgi:C-terminal processing protease CtpA/Prc